MPSHEPDPTFVELVLINRMMPRYPVHQADMVQRFFADGGPPEIRSQTPST